MTHREVLLTLFECYCQRAKLSQARVSTLVFNHGGRIARIRAGRDFTVGSYERALRWFSDQWPEELSWPEGIPRPSRAGQAAEGEAARVAVPGSGERAGLTRISHQVAECIVNSSLSSVR